MAVDGQRKTILQGFAFWGILLAYVVYGLVFIYRTSFLIEGQRYFVLTDDMMISMTYARNLAQGHGLVWNTGDDPVEGFTNLGWVLWMAVLHWLPFNEATISLPVQLTNLLFLVANYFAVNRLATVLGNGSHWAGVYASALCATHYPLTFKALIGWEAGALAFLVTAATLCAIQDDCGWRKQKRALWLLAIGTLIRPDAIVSLLAIGVGIALAAETRQLRRQIFIWTVAIAAACLLISQAFRYWYFGELVPNTYVLKVTGIPAIARISRGMLTFVTFALKSGLLIMVFPLACYLCAPNRRWVIPLAVIAAQVAYNIWIGGVAFELGTANRFLLIVAPVFFALLAASFAVLFARVAATITSPTQLRTAQCGIVLMSLAALGHLMLAQESKNIRETIDLLTLQSMPEPGRLKLVENARNVESITTPEAHVAVSAAGISTYFSHRYAIDLLGKCDKVVARGPHHLYGEGWSRYLSFEPGHTKWDFTYSLGKLRPDVVLPWFGMYSQPEENNDPWTYLVGNYQAVHLPSGRLFLRKDSPNIRWDVVASMSKPTEVVRPNFSNSVQNQQESP